jgi:tetratricopeptide (TPR) repeat protein
VFGVHHPDVAASLQALAGIYDAQHQYDIAEPLYQRALAIQEQTLGAEHHDLAASLQALAAMQVNRSSVRNARWTMS